MSQRNLGTALGSNHRPLNFLSIELTSRAWSKILGAQLHWYRIGSEMEFVQIKVKSQVGADGVKLRYCLFHDVKYCTGVWQSYVLNKKYAFYNREWYLNLGFHFVVDDISLNLFFFTLQKQLFQTIDKVTLNSWNKIRRYNFMVSPVKVQTMASTYNFSLFCILFFLFS